ncbi:MAG: 2Fe-2S iron-sulfur cluster binding domain-containing protein [Betaproteobacteria bacterium]|nr:2Fe-2S iron-sulfur cluster binding domain-containing protein [Betaproteobacteria bacterium]
MKRINITVNGKAVSASVEPRMQLADFLRESLNLTGTHLGCEHGVCGACTLLVDGTPIRSCITLAVACEGARVTTVEGLDEDLIAGELRAAFSREHALQCGYCTPGMLISARDTVMRMPDANERDIRVAMSGNLCRCTGYVGIVRAIQSVITERKAKGLSSPPSPRAEFGPAGSGRARPTAVGAVAAAPAAARAARRPGPAGAADRAPEARRVAEPGVGKPQTTLHESFTVDYPRAKVWAFFGRLGDVATCLPGTSLLGTPTDEHVETRIRIKVGPIVSEFDGAADVVRDASSFSGVIRGSAHDARSRSATRGEIQYVLIEDENGAATRVEVDVGFTLTGPLAQFSRSSIVHDIAWRMTDAFARNLRARLNRGNGSARADSTAGASISEINAAPLILSVIWNRIKTFFRSLLGR